MVVEAKGKNSVQRIRSLLRDATEVHQIMVESRNDRAALQADAKDPLWRDDFTYYGSESARVKAIVHEGLMYKRPDLDKRISLLTHPWMYDIPRVVRIPMAVADRMLTVADKVQEKVVQGVRSQFLEMLSH